MTRPQTVPYSGLCAAFGLISLAAGFGLVILPGIRFAAWMLLGFGLLLLAAALILDLRRVGRAVAGRRGRLGAGSAASVAIFIGITVFVNAISLDRYGRFDFTGVAQFTLTQKTRDVLAALQSPVQVLFFATPQDPPAVTGYLNHLLAEYQTHAPRISLKSVDPEEHPEQARRYGVTAYPTVVFENGKNRRAVPWVRILVPAAQDYAMEAEPAFTAAILEVTGTRQKKIYFLSGHGEADVDGDYSRAREALGDSLYDVQKLDLAGGADVPRDAAALVIAGPQKALAGNEFEAVQKHLKNHGRALILLNPGFPRQFNDLLSPWDVRLEEGTVLDPSSYLAPARDHAMVPRGRNFFALPNTYFPGAAPVLPAAGYTARPLATAPGEAPQVVWTRNDSPIQMLSILRTSPESRVERESDSRKTRADSRPDLHGPFNLGLFITVPAARGGERKGPEGTENFRLAVFGDSDFAANRHFSNVANAELFLRAVHWTAEGSELIRIERKVVPFRRLVAGPEAIRFIRVSCVALLPALFLAAGMIAWWRRR